MKRRRRSFAAALDDQTLWFGAADLPPADLRSFDLEIWNSELAEWPGLESTLRVLRAEVGGRSPCLRIALMPPLCDVRSLPRRGLRDGDIELIHSRDPGRYFIAPDGGASAHVVGGRTQDEAVLIRVRDDLLRAIEAAAGGWTVTLVPAEPLWASAAYEAGVEAVYVVLRDRFVAVRPSGQGITIRRLPAPVGIVDWSPWVEVGSVGDGTSAPATPLEAECEAPRVVTIHEPGPAAATAAASQKLPILTSTASRLLKTRRWRRRSMLMALAGLALIGLGDAAALIRARVEFRDVAARRATIHDAARTARHLHDRALDDAAIVVAQDTVAGRRTSWAALLAELATTLPESDFVTGIIGTRDSVVVEIMTADSSATLDALSVLLQGVRPSGEPAPDTAARRGMVFTASHAMYAAGRAR